MAKAVATGQELYTNSLIFARFASIRAVQAPATVIERHYSRRSKVDRNIRS